MGTITDWKERASHFWFRGGLYIGLYIGIFEIRVIGIPRVAR